MTSRRAGPGPGGAEDVDEDAHFDHGAEAVEVHPGLADHVERRDGDAQRRHDEIEHAARTSGQCHGEQDLEGRGPTMMSEVTTKVWLMSNSKTTPARMSSTMPGWYRLR